MRVCDPIVRVGALMKPRRELPIEQDDVRVQAAKRWSCLFYQFSSTITSTCSHASHSSAASSLPHHTSLRWILRAQALRNARVHLPRIAHALRRPTGQVLVLQYPSCECSYLLLSHGESEAACETSPRVARLAPLFSSVEAAPLLHSYTSLTRRCPLSQCQRVSRSRVEVVVARRLTPLSLRRFWQHTINTAEQSEEDFKHQALPLARIKKVMKSDPEVRVRRIRGFGLRLLLSL